ncbi:MAG TPA: class I SAM-dependent methyltransferase [Burkholderiales bacterium]
MYSASSCRSNWRKWGTHLPGEGTHRMHGGTFPRKPGSNQDTGQRTPSVTEQRDYWDERWEQSRGQYPHQWARRRGAAIVRLVRAVSPGRPRILDLGCGTGWLTEELASIGDAVGIELSERTVAEARQRYTHAAFIAGDILEMPLPAASFDVVVSQEVIAHVSDQVAYVDVAARALVPAGYLILTTANKFVNDRIGWPPSPAGHIEQWLSARALTRMLRPRFKVLWSTTMEPLGHGGILGVINSHKLTQLITRLVDRETLATWKGRAGLGWTRIVLARKRE